MTCHKNFLKKCKKNSRFIITKTKRSPGLILSVYEQRKNEARKFIYSLYTIDRVTLSPVKFAVSNYYLFIAAQ